LCQRPCRQRRRAHRRRCQRHPPARSIPRFVVCLLICNPCLCPYHHHHHCRRCHHHHQRHRRSSSDGRLRSGVRTAWQRHLVPAVLLRWPMIQSLFVCLFLFVCCIEFDYVNDDKGALVARWIAVYFFSLNIHDISHYNEAFFLVVGGNKQACIQNGFCSVWRQIWWNEILIKITNVSVGTVAMSDRSAALASVVSYVFRCNRFCFAFFCVCV
jgi:hypothetical protein